MDYLERHSEHMKFRDLPWELTPRYDDGDSKVKYLGEDGWTLRAAIDEAMRKEPLCRSK